MWFFCKCIYIYVWKCFLQHTYVDVLLISNLLLTTWRFAYLQELFLKWFWESKLNYIAIFFMSWNKGTVGIQFYIRNTHKFPAILTGEIYHLRICLAMRGSLRSRLRTFISKTLAHLSERRKSRCRQVIHFKRTALHFRKPSKIGISRLPA